jgi:hypothetical protein
MQLTNLIDIHLDLARLAKDLDELALGGRLWAVRQWTRAHMATVWEAAKGFRPIGIEHFVPPSVPPLQGVVHYGKNSLPVQSRFEKHFCRTRDPSAQDTLVGRNLQLLSPATGPGYFVARAPSPSEDADGAVTFDYTLVPREKPPLWPAIVPAGARFGRLVYAGMLDIVRGVSTHVSIGRTRRGNAYMDVWFVLVREDPAASPAASTADGA